MSFDPAIALNRFGLGARPDDKAPSDARAWLYRQIDIYEPRPALIAEQPDTPTLATKMAAARASDDKKAEGVLRRETYRTAVEARVLHAVATETPFAERLVQFWANHFAISAEKGVVTPFVGSFEAEAIRPHVMGRFETMLLAVEHHPAMIYFLDQTRSVGPGSEAALRRAQRAGAPSIGLNENLAREILELHTLGVRSGYTQADVTEFARSLTGWSINVPGAGDFNPNIAPGGFIFRQNLHEPWPRTILGRTYWQSGEMAATAVLRDLAVAPQTATHIATKLARHFAGDEPPQSLIDKLASAFTASKGDLPSVYRVLIDAPECWTARPVKFKTPYEWTVSLLRGTGRKNFQKLQAAPLLRELGQPLWEPGSPAGWDDTAARWAAPDALLRRVEAATRLERYFPNKLDPRDLAPMLLARAPSEGTRMAIDGADTRITGMTLLLVSPEFQRR
jgi:uncharacterized protein (DUF1800 family)